MHIRITAPVTFTVAPYFDCFAFLAESSHHPLACLAGFAHGAAGHAWRCRVVTRQLEARCRSTRRAPVLPQCNRGGDRWACLSCSRAWAWEGRLCQLCQEHARLYGIDAMYGGGDREYARAELGGGDRGTTADDDMAMVGGDAQAFDVVTVNDTDAIVEDDLRRNALAGNPLRARICRVYIEQKGDVSKTARAVKRSTKRVREHIEQYRSRLDEIIAGNNSPPEPSQYADGPALVSRAVMYGFGSDGKRIPEPADYFDRPCSSCGDKQTACVSLKKSHCCDECWHPQTVRIRETRFYTSRG